MKIVFMGTPDFAVNVLQGLIDNNYDVVGVVSQPDKKVGRRQILTNTPIKEIALKHNIEVFQPVNIKEEYQKIIDLNPDLICVVAYGKILPKSFLEIFKHGCINVHPSLLPKYRGASPIQASVLNGDKELS